MSYFREFSPSVVILFAEVLSFSCLNEFEPISTPFLWRDTNLTLYWIILYSFLNCSLYVMYVKLYLMTQALSTGIVVCRGPVRNILIDPVLLWEET
jgi:hypothetical protein